MIFVSIVLIVIALILLSSPKANAYFLLFVLLGGGCSSVGATMMKLGVRKPFYPSQISVRSYSSRHKPYVPSPSDYDNTGSDSNYYGAGYSGGSYSGGSRRGYSGGGLSGGK